VARHWFGREGFRLIPGGRGRFGAIDGLRTLKPMDGFAQAIGQGIGGLVAGSFATIGQVLRGTVDVLTRSLPGGRLAAVVFVVLALAAWQLARR
jgi:hypothetical protein